ncbi:helix-turn-helix domain-containing protein [Hymenobacter caeli]|uniref:AraC-like DNA-binding protein n=1 Tax=Hymenobacter caeli TaxID=2735894 RepID=A0ABX2FRE1_9BACT|nr:helix-turn-helix transcriptional regulator [Hymenobacter caeli]NRT19059.1 AraC-like DNA-binding protein [Hymenobacter caeli]
MKIYIKYMVSRRCKILVQEELHKLGLQCGAVELGEVEVDGVITDEQRDHLGRALLKSGLELMDDKRAILVEKIKNVIVQIIHYTKEEIRIKNSEFISDKLNHDYTYLANLFSETTGITIEHYLIAQKIERIKELLLYDELTLTQIANSLRYSSVSHLSNQFKKATGLTPSYFRQLKQYKRRLALEDV